MRTGAGGAANAVRIQQSPRPSLTCPLPSSPAQSGSLGPCPRRRTMRGAESQTAAGCCQQPATRLAPPKAATSRCRAHVGTRIRARGPRGAPASRAQIQRVRRRAHRHLQPPPWARDALHSPARSPRPVILSWTVATRRLSFAAETAEWHWSRPHPNACLMLRPCLGLRPHIAPRRRRLGVHPAARTQVLALFVSASEPICRKRPGQAEFPLHPPSRARRRGASTNRQAGPIARLRGRTVSRYC